MFFSLGFISSLLAAAFSSSFSTIGIVEKGERVKLTPGTILQLSDVLELENQFLVFTLQGNSEILLSSGTSVNLLNEGKFRTCEETSEMDLMLKSNLLQFVNQGSKIYMNGIIGYANKEMLFSFPGTETCVLQVNRHGTILNELYLDAKNIVRGDMSVDSRQVSIKSNQTVIVKMQGVKISGLGKMQLKGCWSYPIVQAVDNSLTYLEK